MPLRQIVLILLFQLFSFLYAYNIYATNNKFCALNEEKVEDLLKKIQKNSNYARSITKCFKLNYYFTSELIKINHEYFVYTSDKIKKDRTFIKRFVGEYPSIIQYIHKDLLSDKIFLLSVLKLNPDVIKFIPNDILNNKYFILKAIVINPNHFLYASDRLKDDYDVVLSAINSDGRMLKYASDRLKDDFEIVKIAVSSYTPSIVFASKRLQNDKTMQKLSKNIKYDYLVNLKYFLRDNYSNVTSKKENIIGYKITNRAKFFSKNIIVDKSYDIKWNRIYIDGQATEKYRMVNNLNKNIGWKQNFTKYPKLITLVEKIFRDNEIDQTTIDSIGILSLWEVYSLEKERKKKEKNNKKEEQEEVDSKKENYLEKIGSIITTNKLVEKGTDSNISNIKENEITTILAFNFYLVRDSRDIFLDKTFSFVTKLLAIAVQYKNEWNITVVDSMFDININMNYSLKEGHNRKYIWDLYKASTKDKYPKVIIKAVEKDKEYFELFSIQPNRKYTSIFKGAGYDFSNLQSN